MKRKRCQCCHELYEADPRSYDRQKTCIKPACRKSRKRQAQKLWKQKNPMYAVSNPIKQKKWRDTHKGYWKEWRSKHAEYVMRNRKAQRVRNAKRRRLIAKGDEINTICIEKIDQIRHLHLIAKGDDCQGVQQQQIDGICRYLKWKEVIAKGDKIDKNVAHMRE